MLKLNKLKSNLQVLNKNVAASPENWNYWYREHRIRVVNAQSVVKTQAPAKEHPETRSLNFLDLVEMMTRPANSMKGLTFSRTPEITPANVASAPSAARFPVGHSKLQIRKRKQLRKRRKVRTAFQLHNVERVPSDQPLDISIPSRVWHRYEYMCLPNELMRQLLRPRIYLDLELQNIRPLGRLVIQLFTEACPAVVLEFVRSCIAMEPHRFSIKRIINPLWIEGAVTFDNSSALMAPTVDHDMRVLNHGLSRGILSFPCHYLRGSKRCFISFALSFKPLNVLNGRRVAFGIVREGLWILDTLQKYGSRTGKPLKNVIVTRCGIML